MGIRERRKAGIVKARFLKVAQWIWDIGKVVLPKPLNGILVKAGEGIEQAVKEKKEKEESK